MPSDYAVAFSLACRSVGGEHCSCISYDIVADQWLITTSVSLQSHQSSAFHFVSQLLDQIDVGLQMSVAGIRSLAAQFPLHGVICVALCTYTFYQNL